MWKPTRSLKASTF
jgi:hypothetical protein